MTNYAGSHVMIVLIGETPEFVAEIKALADDVSWPGGSYVEVRAYESEAHFKAGIQMREMARQIGVAIIGFSQATSIATATANQWMADIELCQAKMAAHKLDGVHSLIDESRLMPEADFNKVFSIEMLDIRIGGSAEAKTRQHKKKKRGHNSDRDRVICKAGYC